MLLIIFIGLFSILIKKGSTKMKEGEIYKSMTTLEEFYDKQEHVLLGLNQYLGNEEYRIKQLRKMLLAKWKDLEQSITNADPYGVHHPVTAYRMIRDWADISERMFDSNALKDLQVWNKQRSVALPNNDDLTGMQHSLIRIQQVYNLPIFEISNGNVTGHKSLATLDGSDLYTIGVTALEIGEYKAALDWFDLALTHPVQDYELQTMMTSHGEVYLEIGDAKKAATIFQEALDIDPSNEELKEKLDQAQKMHAVKRTKLTKSPLEMQYWHMCSTKEVEVHYDVWCEYKVPIAVYAPYKMEVLRKDPWIVQYYDIISEAEIKTMKDLVKPTIQDAYANEGSGRDGDTADYSLKRICEIEWIPDYDRETLGPRSIGRKVSQRIKTITGLKVETKSKFTESEPMQIVNYGVGGQYGYHYDFDENEKDRTKFVLDAGDRVATFLIFLSDVTSGGRTVFPAANLYIEPLAKSAIFWYNFHRDTSRDRRSLHAGCPVVMGNKWIITKWMAQYPQWHIRPCGPRQNSTEYESQRHFSRAK